MAKTAVRKLIFGQFAWSTVNFSVRAEFLSATTINFADLL